MEGSKIYNAQIFTAFVFSGCIVVTLGDEPKKQRNVLFLVADDMRPDIGIYKPGQGFHTPNLDNLASKSLLLKNAYVQQALCSPSRSSFLTSRRPDTTHIYQFHLYFRDVGGNFTTIPQYFKDRGYLTKGIGKIFHPEDSSNFDDPISWNEPYYHATTNEFYRNSNYSWQAVSDMERAQVPLPDDQIVNHTIETLRSIAPKASSGEQPFFLAVGFRRPHLPFVFPKSFIDLYPVVQPPANPYVPSDFPFIAWNTCDGLAKKIDITSPMDFDTGLSEEKTLELRRAYYSCISYIDSLVGMILKELQNLKLDENTIVSFIGDHGWQLGEHNEWCKQTNFELATQAPMMIHIPGMTDQGIATDYITEFLDLFPTLVEAAGFPSLQICPPDSSKVALCTEGKSLMPLILGNKELMYSREYTQNIDIAFSQYPKEINDTAYIRQIYAMGYTMRTQNFRYTEWVKFEDLIAYWDTVLDVELYDHVKDPDENHNVAYRIEYLEARSQLSVTLREKNEKLNYYM